LRPQRDQPIETGAKLSSVFNQETGNEVGMNVDACLLPQETESCPQA